MQYRPSVIPPRLHGYNCNRNHSSPNTTRFLKRCYFYFIYVKLYGCAPTRSNIILYICMMVLETDLGTLY